MRRVLPVFLFLVIVMHSFPVPAIATEESSEFEKLNSNVLSLKLAVMKDGKRIGDKLVNYGIYRKNDKWEGYWIDVGFYTAPGANSTYCTLYNYSTKEGTLKNIKVIPNQITFDMEPYPNAFGESAKVIIKPPGKDYPFTPTIRVTYVDPGGVTDWVVTDRIVISPSEISGYPHPSTGIPKK